MPAAHQRVTLLPCSRQIEIIDLMAFVLHSVRASVGRPPRQSTVSVSGRPSRRPAHGAVSTAWRSTAFSGGTLDADHTMDGSAKSRLATTWDASSSRPTSQAFHVVVVSCQ
jgi:hypothetical protein